jgi:DNA-binding NarL/FixJ family response regulator
VAGEAFGEQRAGKTTPARDRKNEAAQALSPGEIEIIKQVAVGLRNTDIGKKLFISEGTVKIHLHNIYQKLGVDSRTKLARYAREKGFV